MMNKQAKYTNSGMRQDISNSKFSNEFYFEGMNIRILSTNQQSSGAITNTKGNELLLNIPVPVIDTLNKKITYGTKELDYVNTEIDSLQNSNLAQVIIGNCRIKNGFIIFSTNNNGLDCIWFLNEEDFDLTLLYVRDLNFSTEYPIQILNNYENSKIDKIYWIDGKEQIRFFNIHHSIDNDDLEELIDLSASSLNIVSDVDFSEINIEEVSYGGTHTSGMIQYAYSYYKINGSESAISPLSVIIPLGVSAEQGGEPNEVVGTIPKIVINNIDNRFTNLRIYAIKYTSFNELPSVNVIADRNITGLSTFTYFDDGKILFNSTLENIIFNSGKVIIPKHIESKNNRLFAFNYRDRVYKLNLKNNNLDTRAYSFPISSINTSVYSSITGYDDMTEQVIGVSDNISYATNIVSPNFLPFNHSAINGDYNVNRYQPNSTILGGEGYHLKYELIRTTENSNDVYDFRFLKDGELYRLAIQFYNKYGIKSTPNWIADFVVSSDDDEVSNLSGFYAGIKLTLKPEFFVWLNTSSNFLDDNGNYDEFLKPIGFKLLRAERTINDRSIIDQGIINGMMVHSLESNFYPPEEVVIERCNKTPKIPSLMRRFDDYLCPMYGNLTYRRVDLSNHPQWNGINLPASQESYGDISDEKRNSVFQFNQLMQFNSPEVHFEYLKNIESTKIKLIGGINNNFNGLKARRENWTDAEFAPFSIYENVLSPHDIKANWLTSGSSFGSSSIPDTCSRGIYAPTFIHEDYERKSAMTYQFFREYSGTFIKNTNDNIFDIYGKPEIAEFGQTVKKYNQDNDLAYINSLESMSSDIAGTNNASLDNTFIESVLTKGSRTGIFALGDNNIDTEDRLTIEDLFNNSSLPASITGQIGGTGASIQLTDALPIYSNLLAYPNFTNQFIGILSTGDIYYNNNTTDVIGSFDPKDVVYIFDDLAEYDAFATSTVEDLTGKRIAIVDHVDNKIYIVVDQMLSLAGLTDTLETFDYLEPISNPIDQFVQTLSQLYQLNVDNPSLPDNYTVVVLEENKTYEWNIFTEEWDFVGTYVPDPEDLYKGGVGLIVEFINDEKLKYIGNYYGGNSYEAKTKTVYVEASRYFKLDSLVNNYIIADPGDVFVQEYSIARLSKTDRLPDSSAYLRITEIIKVRLESSINQNKRDDESRFEWDASWQPSQGDFHKYNRVYSQQSNLLKSQDFSYEVKQNELYDASIIASKLKTPGEIIDNFASFNVNDTMHLEGKYGSINGVIKHNDDIFTFQDTAIANLSINPRVQIQGDDGIEIKLGTGDILDDYKYLDTNSGTLNKWGIISSNSGIYYYDTINNSLNLIANNKLSDIKHLHSFFQKNINSNIIRKDNHILKEGIQFGYDYLNNDIYFTFLQQNNSLTINFNELQNEFVSLHSFKPSFYFNKGNIFLTTHPDNNKLYEHKEGIYNMFYDIFYPSYVTYNLNPEPDKECIFDNINFKSECYLNGVDQPLITLNGIQAFNDYQDSTLIPLTNGRTSNLRRKFRDWNAIIPREGRTRIRGPYSKLKLQFENEDNYRLILHDIVLGYTS